MPFALDASIVVAWAFPDEQHPVADAALERLDIDDGAVPALWWFAVRNALITGERRQRLDQAATAEFLQRLSSLPIAVDHMPGEGMLLDLARRYRLSVYHAAYLELADRLGIPLATTDSDLITAAPQAGANRSGAGEGTHCAGPTPRPGGAGTGQVTARSGGGLTADRDRHATSAPARLWSRRSGLSFSPSSPC